MQHTLTLQEKPPTTFLRLELLLLQMDDSPVSFNFNFDFADIVAMQQHSPLLLSLADNSKSSHPNKLDCRAE